MSGINRSGRPSTSNIHIGRGSIQLAELNPSTGKAMGFEHVGNVTNLSIQQEVELLTHLSSRQGIRSVDREIILTQELEVTLTTDEITFQNIAKAYSGTIDSAVTNPSRTTQTDRLIIAAAYKGMSYMLLDGNGANLMDLQSGIGSLVIKSGTTLGGASTLTEGTDYTVDRKWGMIFLRATGAHVEGHQLWYTYTTASNEQPIDRVNLLTAPSKRYFLRFIEINAANADKQMVLDLHSISLKADGATEMLGDEFSTITLKGKAERNTLGYPNAPVGLFYFHADS